mmetsp:Transcript_64843/g.159607  ORF Transcript_64843/g.159607 Transcript_64843/m.159607 type:complete len:313 (-) Transcript_64843:172-1110(-)
MQLVGPPALAVVGGAWGAVTVLPALLNQFAHVLERGLALGRAAHPLREDVPRQTVLFELLEGSVHGPQHVDLGDCFGRKNRFDAGEHSTENHGPVDQVDLPDGLGEVLGADREDVLQGLALARRADHAHLDVRQVNQQRVLVPERPRLLRHVLLVHGVGLHLLPLEPLELLVVHLLDGIRVDILDADALDHVPVLVRAIDGLLPQIVELLEARQLLVKELVVVHALSPLRDRLDGLQRLLLAVLGVREPAHDAEDVAGDQAEKLALVRGQALQGLLVVLPLLGRHRRGLLGREPLIESVRLRHGASAPCLQT